MRKISSTVSELETAAAIKLRGWIGETRKSSVRRNSFPSSLCGRFTGMESSCCGGGEEEAGDPWEREGDALITGSPGIAIGVFTADCLPLLLFEPERRVAAVVHAGWRGTAKEVTRKVVEKMAEVFACAAEKIQAALGPCIGPCCYEVDGPVEAEFRGGGLPWESFASGRGPGKWSLDLQEANTHLLIKSGVKRENIRRLAHCTACRSDLFFSYRREKGTRGRHLNFISLL